MLGGTGDSVQCGWEGQTFGADHPDPTRPRGGGAVQTHCRLSRASREQTLYGNRVEGRADHSDPTRPRGGWRSANALQAQQSQPRADPAWLSGGGQTTQTPEGPEGGGAVQTHCRLSRASRQQTPYGNGVGCGCGHVWKAEREHVCVWCVCVVWQERVYFKMPNVPCPNVPMSSIVQCPMSQCNVPMMSQCPNVPCPNVHMSHPIERPMSHVCACHVCLSPLFSLLTIFPSPTKIYLFSLQNLSFFPPCSIMSYHVLPCPTMSYHVIPCPTMSYHVLPCPSMSYHVFHQKT